MGRALLVLDSNFNRRKAHDWIDRAPVGTRVEFKASRRSLPQNDRMWSMLTEISEQVGWHGKKLSTQDWKLVFLDALKRAHDETLRIVPNTDGTGFVNLSTSSSDLDKDEMTDMIELMFEFGAKHGVVFRDPEQNGRAA